MDVRLLTIKQVMVMTGFGRQRSKSFCDRIGATRRFSERTIRYDRKVIEEELDKMGRKEQQSS